MKNKPFFYFLVILGGSLFFSTCEKDDFCLQTPVTPKLVLRFYDDINRDEPTAVNKLSVFVENRLDSLFKEISTDSIAIPLNPQAQQTVYKFRTESINIADANREVTVTLDYDIRYDYVSRSCGYRVLFENVQIAISNEWVESFTPAFIPLIDSQTEAHVQIFH